MIRLNKNRKEFLDKQVAFSKYVIDTDKLDIHFFEDVKKTNPKINEVLKKASEGYKPFPELQQDIFSSLYRYKPRLLKEHKVKPEYLLNRAVMQEVVKAPKYRELRAITRLNQINSTVGTEVLGDEAHQLIKKLKEQQENLQEMLDAEAAANKAGQQGQDKGSQGEQGGDGKKEGKSSKEWTIKEAQKELEEAKKKFNKSMKKKEVQQAVHKILDKVHNQVIETSDMISNWGLDGDDTFIRMGYHEKMELLKKLRDSSKLKRIAELAGRFKRIATQRQREKVRKGMDEIYDISQGNEIGKLIPSELMKLRHPATKLLFFKDFAEKKLLQYDLRGKEKKQRGAIVACIDDSGKDFYLTISQAENNCRFTGWLVNYYPTNTVKLWRQTTPW